MVRSVSAQSSQMSNVAALTEERDTQGQSGDV